MFLGLKSDASRASLVLENEVRHCQIAGTSRLTPPVPSGRGNSRPDTAAKGAGTVRICAARDNRQPSPTGACLRMQFTD